MSPRRSNSARLFLTASSALFLLATSLLAQLSDQELAAGLKTYLTSSDSAARTTARTSLLAVGPAGLPRLETLLADGCIYDPQPTGVLSCKLHIDFNNTDTDYVLCVPPGYDPKKSYPLLIALHGTGGTGQGFYARWQNPLRDKDFLVAAPTAATEKRTQGYGATEAERQLPLAVIRDVRRRYHVDSNRVFIAGVSMGGHAAWDNLLCFPNHYAAGIVEAGIPIVEGFQIARYLFLPNLFQTGVYVMQGTPDKDSPQINREAVDRLKRLDSDAVYVEFPGAGHGAYPAGTDAALTWLLPHHRDPWPRHVRNVAHRLIHAQAFWIHVDAMQGSEWDPHAQVNVHTDANTPKDKLVELAARDVDKKLIHVDATAGNDNTVTVTCSRVRKLTLQFHPTLVDFSRKVKIIVNGRVLFFGMLKPDPAVLLDAATKEYDFQRLPHAAVTLSLSSTP